MHTRAVRLAAAVLVSCLAMTAAIFEEQAGEYDWHRRQLGRITHAQFAARSRSRAFVATEAAVVAALDLRDGGVIWRQVLAESEHIQQLVLLPKPAAVATLSVPSGLVRLWNAADGVLLWERQLAELGAVVSAAIALLNGDSEDSVTLAALAKNKLQVFAGSNGRLTCQSDSLLDSIPLASSLSASAAAVGVALLEQGGKQVTVATVSPASQGRNEVTAKHSAKLPAAAAKVAALSADAAVALAADGSKLCLVTWSAAAKVECATLESGLVSFDSSSELQALEGTQTVAVLGRSGSAVYAVDGPALKLLGSFPGATAVSQPTAAEGNALAAVARLQGGDSAPASVSLVDLATGKVVEKLAASLNLTTDSGKPVGLSLVALSRRGNSGSHRLLLGAEEGTLALLEGQEVAWLREEALGHVQGALFVDLPAPSAEIEAKQRESALTLSERIHAELLAAKEQLGFSQPADAQQLAQLRARSSTRLLPWRDAAGFRKLLIVLSGYGKLLGLHSGDGRVLWGLPLDAACAATHLHLWRSSHDAVHAPQVVVLGNGPSGACYTVVDAHTGTPVTGGALPHAVNQVLEAPVRVQEGATEQHVLLLVSGSPPAVQVLPDNSIARSIIDNSPASLHFWHANASTGSVQGWQVKGTQNLELAWATSFNPGSSSILAAATRAADEPVYSHAKVLGDRSLKLKYLNPNLLLLISGVPDGLPVAKTKRPQLTVSVLDTVTGQVLYRQSHQDARGPVQAVLCENWAVYHFWSTSSQRHEMAVIELYDVTPRDMSVARVLFAADNATQSAYLPPPLEALTQTFAIKEGVRAIVPVATQRGITAKLLLLATQSEQVYMMDKRFLDPRRPKGTPSKDDQAEMLLPFDPELPIVATLYASHRKTIARISGFVVSPAIMESTALVFAHGLDVFLTRVQPSRNFDLIPDDFPYGLLIGVTLILAAAAVALKRLEGSSSVSRKWT